MVSRSLVLRLAAAAALSTLPGVAAAQPSVPAPVAPSPSVAPARPLSETLTGEAKSAYELGRSLFGNGDFANALSRFQRAHALSGDARLLWNVVACASRLHRYTQLLSLLEELKKEGSSVLLEEDWKMIAALEQSVGALVSPLQLTVNEAGAEVSIDDAPVGKTPLAGRVLMDGGPRKIRIVKPGFKEVVRVEQVAPGAPTSLQIVLEPLVHSGKLSVVAAAHDRITLDGKLVGEGRWEGTVQSGNHTLRVAAPGMVPYQADIVIQDEQLNRVQVGLTPAAGSGLPVWAWVAGGVAVAAGLVIGGVFALKPDPEPLVQGTLGPTLPTSFGGRW
jgi:hypothetical protein